MNYTPIKLKIKIKEWPERAKAGAQGTNHRSVAAGMSYLVFAPEDFQKSKPEILF